MVDTVVDTAPLLQRQHGSLAKEALSQPEGQIMKAKYFGLLEDVRDREHRSKLIQSWLIILAFFTLGLFTGQLGTTLIDLQIITGTDLERASALVTAIIGGMVIGALISGVVFDKINTHLLIVIGLLGLSVTSIISPYCSSYPLMFFMRMLCGVFVAIIESAGNAWQMRTWGIEGKVLMQIMHFVFGLGGVLSPLYTEPFLAKRIVENETAIDNVTFGKLSDVYVASDPQTTNVHYAFLVSGVLTILASIPFVVLFIKQRSQNIRNIQYTSQQDENNKLTYRQLPCCLHFFTLIMICSFFFLYCGLDLTFSSFLMAFLVNEFYSITKSEALYITTVYWVSFAISRFIMIFLSKVLSSLILLSLCITLMILAYTGFFTSVVFEESVAIAVFTAMAGLGMSAVFAAGYSWTETELLKVTARVSASISITACVGRIVIPLFLGYLMDEVSNRWFCYLLLGQTALICLIFIFLLLFNRLFINKVYGSMTWFEQNVADNGKRNLLIECLKEECQPLMNAR